MKRYLDLVPLSAKAHKRQNRMTILCIVIAVLLVTVIFSMADMFLRSETEQMNAKHGSWHLSLEDPTEPQRNSLRSQTGLLRSGMLETFNFDGSAAGYLVENKKAVLYGADESTLQQFDGSITEGHFPQNDTEAMLTPNAADSIGAALGSTVTVHTPAGDYTFTVCGIGTADASYYESQTYLVGVYLMRETFEALLQANGASADLSLCYLQFDSAAHAAKARQALEEQGCSVQENVAVMGLAGQSSNASMRDIYVLAVVLFVLVLLAGVLMISGSLNSSIAQRTRFFGMLRCTGASRAQVVRIVRLEALNWCKTAVPIGLVLGTGISWAVCAALHYGIGGEWVTMPVGKLSVVGLVSGTVVGILTVLLAAQAPARRAARVSPIAAVSGSRSDAVSTRHAAALHGRVEIALGVRHTTESRKSWALMTASFALSILLFFAFSVLLDFVKLLMPTMLPYQPDIILNGYANAFILDSSLADEIAALPGVTGVDTVSLEGNIPILSSDGTEHLGNLCSYTESMLQGAKQDLARGTLDGVAGDNGKVALLYNRENVFQVGDTITINGQELTICGVLSQGIGSDDQTIFCSQETFDRIMEIKPFNSLYVHVAKDVPADTLAALHAYESADIIVQDVRLSTQKSNASYWATRIGAYSFLAVLALISLINILNSISMSVASRTKQYGILRAIGLDSTQLTRMIAAETATCSLSGLVLGCGLGLVLQQKLYGMLITHYFGQVWQLPVASLCIIVVFVLVSTALAVYFPTQRLKQLSVTAAINEL